MKIKRGIKSNEELYGDFELIPLNLDAVEQRIEFFRSKVTAHMEKDNRGSDFLRDYIAWEFWKDMKDKHCLQTDSNDTITREKAVSQYDKNLECSSHRFTNRFLIHDIFNHFEKSQYKRPTHEEGYLRTHREEVDHKEEEEWTKLEKKIGSKTIDCRKNVTPNMRAWYFEKYGHYADDCSILMKWEEEK